jgi:hypothetical protein
LRIVIGGLLVIEPARDNRRSAKSKIRGAKKGREGVTIFRPITFWEELCFGHFVRKLTHCGFAKPCIQEAPLLQMATSIDCNNKDWRGDAKAHLQKGEEVELKNLDYTTWGKFCEMLAIAHSMRFVFDAKNKTGAFKRNNKSR